MKDKHLMSNTLYAAGAAAVVLGMCTTVTTATEPCGDFGECKVLIEINSSDGDIGFHFLMDGDDLNSARIHDPNGIKVFEDFATGALLEQKLTETFAESAEPVCRNKLKEEPGEEVVTLEEFLERWADGSYFFFGFSDDEILLGDTELTYDLPAAPTDLDFDGSVISWDAGNDLGECATKKQLDKLFNRGVLTTHPEDVAVAAWEVVFEPDVDAVHPANNLKFTIRVPFSQTSVTVPADYLLSLPANTPAKIEVGAIGEDDNATFTEEDGICVNEVDEGCD